MNTEVEDLKRLCRLIVEFWYLTCAVTLHRDYTKGDRVVDSDGYYMLELQAGDNFWQPGRIADE